MPWRHQSTPCASLRQDFPSFWCQRLCLYFTHPKNVFKTAVTGSSLQAPQGWDEQRLSSVQTQGKESLSDEVWTHDLALALLFKLPASKGQDLKEL